MILTISEQTASVIGGELLSRISQLKSVIDRAPEPNKLIHQSDLKKVEAAYKAFNTARVDSKVSKKRAPRKPKVRINSV